MMELRFTDRETGDVVMAIDDVSWIHEIRSNRITFTTRGETRREISFNDGESLEIRKLQ
jgi:hypothetical protein